MEEKNLSFKDLQQICFKEKDCVIMRAYRRISTRITFAIYKNKGLLPWHITILSFIVAILGAGCLLSGSYEYLVAAAILFQISFILDCVDGEIARINKTGSPFGAWLDPRFDYYSMALYLGAAAIGQYWLQGNIDFLLIAIPAIINLGMVSEIIGTRAAYVPKTSLQPTLGKNKSRIGHRGLTALIITIGLLANSVFAMLAIFAVLWVFVWIKMIVDFYRLVKRIKAESTASPAKN
ncbi:MAG: CDP-alcohol phosphatidyltransferase family protein [Candidatus Diapherotrites archaeon]|nr:CDP-alcohol phosphatidyltransferase family protein [Candidatus Diapherotrites archaeon]